MICFILFQGNIIFYGKRGDDSDEVYFLFIRVIFFFFRVINFLREREGMIVMKYIFVG